MRLALFTDTLTDINGVARFLADLREAAPAAGHELRVFASTRKPLGLDEIAHQAAGLLINLPPTLVHSIPAYSMLDVALPPLRKMASELRAFTPDIIHVSTPGPVGLCGRWLAHRHNIPLVGTYHTDFPAYARRIYGIDALSHIAGTLTEWFYKPFCKLLVRSIQSEHQLANGRFALPPLVVLPPGINLRRFTANTDELSTLQWQSRICAKFPLLANAISTRRPIVLSVGRISREKNTTLLCETWKLLTASSQPPSARPMLLVVGDGPGLSELRSRLTSAAATTNHAASPVNAKPDFLLTGFATGQDLLDLYRCGSVLFLPSVTDTLGQVTLEAQAMGVPAIVSNQGGPQRLIVPGITGLVVSDQNPASWAAAVRSVTDTPTVLAAMRAAAQAHAQTMPFEQTSYAFWVEHRNVLAQTHQAGSQSKGRSNAGR